MFLLTTFLTNLNILLTSNFLDFFRHELIENIEGAIVWSLKDNTRLLQHEDLHLNARQLSLSFKVNAYEPNLQRIPMMNIRHDEEHL